MSVMKMPWMATPDSRPLIHFTLRGNWRLQQKDLEQFLISFALVSISHLPSFFSFENLLFRFVNLINAFIFHKTMSFLKNQRTVVLIHAALQFKKI